MDKNIKSMDRGSKMSVILMTIIFLVSLGLWAQRNVYDKKKFEQKETQVKLVKADQAPPKSEKNKASQQNEILYQLPLPPVEAAAVKPRVKKAALPQALKKLTPYSESVRKPIKVQTFSAKPLSKTPPVFDPNPRKKPKSLKIQKPLQDKAEVKTPASASKPINVLKPTKDPLPPKKPETVATKVIEKNHAIYKLVVDVAPKTPKKVTAQVKTPPVSLKKILKSDIQKGRALLKILEHGKGPSIEIAWPNNARQRTRLFETLSACYGMKMALFDNNNIYMSQGGSGRATTLNLDKYSGYIRQIEGSLTPPERRYVRKLRQYHGNRIGGEVIRIFPRNVDAQILGGIKHFIGDNYMSSRVVSSKYTLKNGTVFLEGITVDGRFQPITIPLTGRSSC